MLMMVPPVAAQVTDRGAAAVHDTPEIGLEQTLLVFERNLRQLAVDRDAGIVDPRVQPAERAHRGVGNAIQLGGLGDVGRDINGAPSPAVDLVRGAPEILLVAGRQHYPCAARGRFPRRSESDSARRARNHDCLVSQLLRLPAAIHQAHGFLPFE